LTYVRTGDKLHAVLLPAFEHQPGVDRFDRFLAAQGDAFEVSVARFEGTLWTVEKTRQSVAWPPASLIG
jgi:hypothetical protein